MTDARELIDEARDEDKSAPPGAEDYMEILRHSEELSKKVEDYDRSSRQNSVSFTNHTG